MRDIIKNALVTSLESEIAGEPMDSTDTVDAALSDQQSAADDIAADVQSTDELQSTLESLCQVAGELQNALQTGGVTPQAARFMNITVGQAAARVGMESQSLGLESFGGTMTSMEATQVTLETVGEMASKIWNAILKACDRVWNSVLAFINRLFATRKLVGQRIASLERQLHTIDSSKSPKSMKLDLGGLTQRLARDNKIGPLTAAEIKGWCEKIDASVKNAEDASAEIIKQLGSYLQDPSFAKLKEVATTYGQSLRTAIPNATKPLFVLDAPADTDIWAGPLMPGGRALAVLIPRQKISPNADEATLARQMHDILRGVRFDLLSSVSKSKADPVIDLPTVKEVLDLCRELRIALGEHDDSVNKRLDELSKKIKADLNEYSKKDSKAPEEALRMFGRLATHMGGPIVKVQHYRLDLINNLSRYVQKVVDHYRKG